MKFENFKDGNHFTIGMELELRLLDKFDLTPRNEFNYIKENVNDIYKENLAKEFLGSMVEINTPIFHNENELISYMKDIIETLKDVASKKNLVLQTSGSYAQEYKNMEINESERYEKLYEEHQILLKNFAICGTHVHVGFEDFDKALKAYNYSLYYLPLLVAISASSPFFNNTSSGIHSYRTKIFDRLPKGSIPEYFDSYEHMKEVYDLLHRNKVIETTKDIWWDVRIQPHFKTIEFRVCDAVNDFDRLELVAMLCKLVSQLSQLEDVTRMPMQVLKQNMWSATRYSMDGQMVTNEGLVSIKDMINALLEKGFEKSMISKDSKEKMEQLLEKKSISQNMIDVYNRTDSLKEVERLGVFE